MGLLHYGLLGAILAFTVNQSEVSQAVVVGIIALYATIFYYYVMMVMMTLKEISFDWESGVNYIWQTRVILSMAMAILMMQGYIAVFYYVLPFFVIGFIGDIFSTLLLLGFISLNDAKEDPED
jgi:hypothetical protein